MLVHEFHGLLQLVWRVECEQFHALEVSLRNPGQRARRWHFQEASDTQVAHRGHAQIPTNWRGQLAHQPLENLPTIVNDLPIGVRQQAGSRVVGGDGPRQRGETRNSGLHVDGMEGTGNAERNESGAPRRISRQRSQLLSRTSRDNLAAAIVVGCSQAVCASRAASTSSGSPPMTAVIDVGSPRWLRP